MRYFIAIVLPPLAVLLCGKPGQAILNVLLTCILWAPGALHAVLVVHSTEADRRQKELIAAIANGPRGR
jgi:uncharacterized membrane protein YqaE (UPF0057 family)